MNRHERRQTNKQSSASHSHSPNQLKQLNQLISAAAEHHNAGRFNVAEEAYRKILGIWPNSPEVHNNLGCVLDKQNKCDDAITCYERALALRPHFAEAHNNLGYLLYLRGEFAKAAACFERAVAITPNYAQAHYNLGTTLMEQNRLTEAETHFRQALTIQPDYVEAHHNLGGILMEQNKLNEAEAQLRRALTIQPDYADTHLMLSGIKTFHTGDADLAALEALAAKMDYLPASKQLYIHFALGKALEDVGEYSRSFEHLIKGNGMRRRDIHYDEAANIRYFHDIADVFSSKLFDRFQNAGDGSPVPIFIVGMPRSGSTLVEQILASHPQVQGAGELDNLNIVANSLSRAHAEPVPYPVYVPALDAAMLQKLGQAYLQSVPLRMEGKTRVTDKGLSNFVYIGLIRLILPNAKIIHTMRDPMDTCLSCFAQCFRSGQHFTFDLAELGRYYRRYVALMEHWRSVLPPGAMLDLSYEEVVDDFEAQAKRLVEYCGLPWDDRCLSFHKTKRTIRTASSVQVRQPLYRSSMQRWRKYEPFLGQLLAELG